MADHDDKDTFDHGRIVDQDIEDELKSSYLTYAMSVIVSRALPDARDGLKPSQRRILLAMHDLNLTPGARFKKCAKIVGECMGKYHPHGDSAIYPTLVRMAQNFSIRYPLIDGQGNFGSIDGDPPAAMRYTEARMARSSMDLLEDLEKDTVFVGRNFDESEDEPSLLPGKFPNLLCNGSTGIAVGMATSIPPHNVNEICDGLIALIRNPDITIDELFEIIPGPDFPTGGIICGRAGIFQAYKTGRGLIRVRAKYHVEEGKTKDSIIVTEIPYQESKENLINKIVVCVKDDRVTGISDVRDESDRDGIRLVIELRRDADAEVVINQLFKHTSLQTTFSIINIALVDARPETLTLKEMLNEHKKHRVIVIRRRTRYLLRKAEHRLHIVAGLLKALDHIDQIIQLIRSSSTADEARGRMIAEFEFSELQAREILQMRLQRLTGLERTKLEEERDDLMSKIADYKDILARGQRILDIILDDLSEVKSRYGDPRRTEITDAVEDFNMEDLIAEEDVVVTVSRGGYFKRTPLTVYRSQGRGGIGITGSKTKEGDDVKDLFIASTHSYMLLFTNLGRLYWLKVYGLPDLPRTSKGRSIVNLIQLTEGETVTQQLCVSEFRDDQYVLTATRNGIIKKTALNAYSRPKRNGIIALALEEGDALIGVDLCSRDDTVILGTRGGKAVRFSESMVRAMGRNSRGVRGIRLRGDDVVVDMVVVPVPKGGAPSEDQSLLTLCEKGFGKRTSVDAYPIQGRGGSGVIDIRTTTRNGEVVALKAVTNRHEIVIMTSSGIIMRMSLKNLRNIGRATQGVKLISLRTGDRVVGVERVLASEESEAVDADGADPGTNGADPGTNGADPDADSTELDGESSGEATAESDSAEPGGANSGGDPENPGER